MALKRLNVEDRPSTVNRSDRPTRVPINGLRDKLTVKGQEPGWHYTWQIEVDKFLGAGYEFVTHEVIVGDRKVDRASQIGGKVVIPGGNGVDLVLMRCPDEIYNEELELMTERVDMQEAAMRRDFKGEGRYGEVKIEQSKPLSGR